MKIMDLNELNLNEEQLAAVTKYVQSETDKVRTKYVQELAKYKPAEKTEAEIKLEERIQALEAREQELQKKERSATIAAKLKEKGLPEDLSSLLNIGENIDEDVEKVGNALGNYFLNTNYKPESHAVNKGITKEQFRKMGYTERAKLYQENPELYKILSK